MNDTQLKMETPVKRLARLLRLRPDSSILVFYMIKCVMHYHAYRMAQELRPENGLVNSF